MFGTNLPKRHSLRLSAVLLILLTSVNFLTVSAQGNSEDTTSEQAGSRILLPLVSSFSDNEAGTSSAVPASYFVDRIKGIDATTRGSQSAPWKSIQWAADHAVPGSIINVLGNATGTAYCETVRIHSTRSGSASAPTTFQNYQDPNSPAYQPILDGSCLDAGSAKSGFTISGASYVVIKGFIIQNYVTTVSANEVSGIAIGDNAHHIYIQNNRIRNIKTQGQNSDVGAAYGIKVRTESGQSMNSIFIDGNELYNLVLGNSEALSINGDISNFWITNNSIHNADNIGIDAIGFEGNSPSAQARNGYIINNQVYNIDASHNPAYSAPSAAGIYVDGGDSIVIERNKSYGNNIGIEVASENANHYATNVTVRSNFVYNNMIAGISIGGGASSNGGTEGCWIVNNTLFNNNSANQNGELWIQYHTSRNIIENNIIYAGPANVLIANVPSSANMINYNFYYTTGNPAQRVWLWLNKEYTDFAAYKTVSKNDTNSSIDNPMIYLASDTKNFLHLQTTSLAINKGTALDAAKVGTKDIDGDPRLQNQLDIGADEVR